MKNVAEGQVSKIFVKLSTSGLYKELGNSPKKDKSLKLIRNSNPRVILKYSRFLTLEILFNLW